MFLARENYLEFFKIKHSLETDHRSCKNDVRIFDSSLYSQILLTLMSKSAAKIAARVDIDRVAITGVFVFS